MTMLGERTGPGHRRVRRSRRERMRRSVRRAMRGRNAKWVLAALAAVTVLIVGLLAEGYLGSPAHTIASPGTDAARPPASAPFPSARPRARRAARPVPTANVLGALTAKLPYNPLNHLRGGGLHDVVIQATSAAPLPFVGYLVPTGLSSPYAKVYPHGGRFRFAQQALGPGYLAAVFVQNGAAGVPITCAVYVDGKRTNVETARGSYGRAVCLG